MQTHNVYAESSWAVWLLKVLHRLTRVQMKVSAAAFTHSDPLRIFSHLKSQDCFSPAEGMNV